MEKFLGPFLGKSGPYQAVPAAFPRNSLKQPEGHLLPPGYQGLCISEQGWGGIWTPQPCECDSTQKRMDFYYYYFLNLDVSRAAGLAGQRDAFPLAEINR